MLRRAYAIVATVAAALVLSGCFVVSTNVPAGQGPINDPRLVGTWRSVSADGDEQENAFLHFQRTQDGKPLRLVWVEDDKYQIYELNTLRIANKNVFAAKLTGPAEVVTAKDAPKGYFIGFYDFKSPTDMSFSVLDSEKIGELIAKGKLKGVRPPGKYEIATLTGSPDELARFLASADAQAARIEPAHLRRLTQPRN